MKEAYPFELNVAPPFDWPALLRFLSARAITGVEEVDDGCYRRSLRVDSGGRSHEGFIALRFEPRGCLFEGVLSSGLKPVAGQVIQLIRHFIDADCDPAAVNAVLGPLSAIRPGLRVPGAFDGFELAVRAVLGQQVSVAAARTLAGRFAVTFGKAAGESHCFFPTPAQMASCEADRIARLGIVSSRAQCIVEVARAMAENRLDLRWGVDLDLCAQQLTTIRGIGEWTAQYLALRVVGWRDAFPHGDLAVRKALGGITAKQALQHAERWRPFRAYATMHPWQSLHQKPRS